LPHFLRVATHVLGYLHRTKVPAAHRASSFAKAPIFAKKLRRGETKGQGIARRKVMGSAVGLTTMTDSLHSHNSNPRNRVKGFASRSLIVHLKLSCQRLCPSPPLTGDPEAIATSWPRASGDSQASSGGRRSRLSGHA